MTRAPLLARGLGLALVAVLALRIASLSLTREGRHEVRLTGYTTSLKGRKKAQIRNATLAARALEGQVIGPGKVFSYNAVVVAGDRESRYVPAPVSVEGSLVAALGGGVCQTSTTLYNAALLAGLEVVERHPHTIAPKYVLPGRDAAVAWPGVDLRIKNPYPFPVRLGAQVRGEQLRVEVFGARPAPQTVTLETRVLQVQEPGRQTRTGNRHFRAGTAGVRVATYRMVGGRRERLTEDSYATVDAVEPD